MRCDKLSLVSFILHCLRNYFSSVVWCRVYKNRSFLWENNLYFWLKKSRFQYRPAHLCSLINSAIKISVFVVVNNTLLQLRAQYNSGHENESNIAIFRKKKMLMVLLHKYDSCFVIWQVLVQNWVWGKIAAD